MKVTIKKLKLWGEYSIAFNFSINISSRFYLPYNNNFKCFEFYFQLNLQTKYNKIFFNPNNFLFFAILKVYLSIL